MGNPKADDTLNEIVEYIDKEIDVNAGQDISLNGLQVQNSGSIAKIGVAVDANLTVFKKAKEQGCNLLIVHHGLFWGGTVLTGNMYRRVKFLIENDIALYGAHLPLDRHPEIGNNALLFNLLGAKIRGVFAEVGFYGEFAHSIPRDEIVAKLDKELNTKSNAYLYGKEKIKTLAIVSGRAHRSAEDAIKIGLDLYITGEAIHGSEDVANDSEMNVICPGHYATETLGVKALGELVAKKFGIEFVFLDHPTGL
ncbi:MAG: Nif3-like dinuclear metal center hexameric protein [Nanoarchaeota archaeon]|nr:Nif3-like dinuclear metal center hexameric protein [Nanoarchaeota archaeon]